MSTKLGYLHLYASRPILSASRCIRVLHVHDSMDGDGSEYEPIECHLTVVNLDDKPEFKALSYVWGSSGSFKLLCDDVRLPVTTNCYMALWHLRKKLGAFCIWVDAVCINQKSKKEKEQQIPLMGDIYAGASEVYIWLGAGSAATERAMSYMAQGGLESYRSGRSAFWSYLLYRWSSKRTMVPESLNATGHLAWTWKISPLRYWRIARGNVVVSNDDLDQLLHCAWTNRIWTYQEVLLSTRPVLVTGTHHVPWNTFASALAFLEMCAGVASMDRWTQIMNSRARYRASMSDDLVPALWSQYLTATRFASWDFGMRLVLGTLIVICLLVLVVLCFWSINHALLGHHHLFDLVAIYTSLVLVATLSFVALLFVLPPNPSLPFNSAYKFWDSLLDPSHRALINTICWRGATEPRDMVYGVLPMLQRMPRWPLLRVNYSAPLSQIYTDLAIFFLIACNDANMLALAAEARCPGGPSWVPDFSKTLRPISTMEAARPLGSSPPSSPTDQYIRMWLQTLHMRCLSFCYIKTVSDFVDPTYLPTHMYRKGRIHNALCIMQTLGKENLLQPLYGAQNMVVDDSLWCSVFQTCFRRLPFNIDRKRLKRYYTLVAEAVHLKETSIELLGMLKTKGLLDVHDFVCHSFANSQGRFFVGEARYSDSTNWDSTSASSSQKLQGGWLGYVGGQQQGMIQAGDVLIRVAGVLDFLVYRTTEEALVARLSESQSKRLADQCEKMSITGREITVVLH